MAADCAKFAGYNKKDSAFLFALGMVRDRGRLDCGGVKVKPYTANGSVALGLPLCMSSHCPGQEQNGHQNPERRYTVVDSRCHFSG